MRKLLPVIVLKCLVTCSPVFAQDADANALIVSAMGLWNTAQTTDDDAVRLQSLREVRAALQEIVTQHPGSSHAVTLTIGESVGPLSLSAVETEISAACEAAPTLCGTDGGPSAQARLNQAFDMLSGLPGGFFSEPLRVIGQAYALRGQYEQIEQLARSSIPDAMGQNRAIDDSFAGMLWAGAARGAALAGDMDVARNFALNAAEAFDPGPFDYDQDRILQGDGKILRDAMLWAGLEAEAPPVIEPFDITAPAMPMDELRAQLEQHLIDAEDNLNTLPLLRALEEVIGLVEPLSVLPTDAVSRIEAVAQIVASDRNRSSVAYIAEGAVILAKVASGDNAGALDHYDRWRGQHAFMPHTISEKLIWTDPAAAASWLQRVPDPNMQSHYAVSLYISVFDSPDWEPAWDALRPLMRDRARLDYVLANSDLAAGDIGYVKDVAELLSRDNPQRAFILYGEIADAALRQGDLDTAAIATDTAVRLLGRFVDGEADQAFYALPMIVRRAAAVPEQGQALNALTSDMVGIIENSQRTGRLPIALATAVSVEALTMR